MLELVSRRFTTILPSYHPGKIIFYTLQSSFHILSLPIYLNQDFLIYMLYYSYFYSLLALRGLGVYSSRQHKTSRKNSLSLKHLYFKYCTNQNLCLYSPQFYKTGMMATCLNIVISVKKVREIWFCFEVSCPFCSFYNMEVVREFYLQ